MSIEVEFTDLPIYAAASGAYTPPATPTDMITIYGSSTKIIRVLQIVFSGTTIANSVGTYSIIKRSATNTGGTTTTLTNVPFNSATAAATASVKKYTANATGLGAAVGTIASQIIFTPGLASQPGVYTFDFCSIVNSRGIVLNGTSEGLALNFGGLGIPAGLSFNCSIFWTEE